VSYTTAAVLGAAAAVLVDVVLLRTRLILRGVWWVTYALVLCFQLISNGICVPV